MRALMSGVLLIVLVLALIPAVRADDTLTIQINHGLLLKLKGAERVVVAAPDVADVSLITRNELMIIAKRVGETTISVWDTRGYNAYRVVVIAAPAPDIARAIADALREPNVQVKLVGDTIVLEGRVKTEADKKRADEIAKAFGPRVANALAVDQPPPPPPPTRLQVQETALREALRNLPVVIRMIGEDTVLIEGTVANQQELRRIEAIAAAFVKNAVLLLRMREPLQIRVDTSFVEVDRQVLRQMGVEWGGGNITDLLTDPFTFHFGNVNQPWPLTPMQLLVARLKLLEQNGAARTLANPRLVVMEGRPAKLLVGGEVPIPVVGADRTVTIMFREFGVRLEFKPVVEGSDTITMDLKSEVSSLDFANAITAAGFVIPTIKKREVQTVVNMRAGEFLLLGGLIQRDVSQNVAKLPVLGDIPILGALFRSVRFQRGETELVVFVSPSVVRPTREAPAVPEEPSSP